MVRRADHLGRRGRRASAEVPASVFDSVGVDAPAPRWSRRPCSTGQPPLTSSGQARGPLRRRRVLPVLRRRAVAAHRGPVPVRALRHPPQHAVGPTLGLPGHPDLQLRGHDLLQPVPDLHRRRALLRRRQRRRRLHPDRHAHPGQSALWPATAPRPEPDGDRGHFPFVDIDNRMVDLHLRVQPGGASCGQSQSAIAGALEPDRTTRPARPSWPRPTT